MRYRYLDDFRRGISVFAIFSYGIAVLGTPQCPPLHSTERLRNIFQEVPVVAFCRFPDPSWPTRSCKTHVNTDNWHPSSLLTLSPSIPVTAGSPASGGGTAIYGLYR